MKQTSGIPKVSFKPLNTPQRVILGKEASQGIGLK